METERKIDHQEILAIRKQPREVRRQFYQDAVRLARMEVVVEVANSA
jgi:hypothetical protein